MVTMVPKLLIGTLVLTHSQALNVVTGNLDVEILLMIELLKLRVILAAIFQGNIGQF